MSDQNFEKLNILILEDSPTQALLLQTRLEEHQIQVQVAKDGIEGLKKLESYLPHIIISDIEMPGMNGYDFCKSVKMNASFKVIPLILLTSLSNPLDLVKGIECGCDGFLTKPCEMNILLSTIHDARENIKLNKTASTQKKLEFFFNGKHYELETNQEQMTSLLLSTYSNAIQKNLELEQAYAKLNQVYEELQKKNQELSKMNQQKNQFLGMAAHDLRNPLVIISGYSELLMATLKETLPEKLMQMLQRIKASSAHMLQLINDLLDISVIESGTVSLNLSLVNLTELIQENLTMLEGIAEKKQIHLNFHHQNRKVEIQCDANKVTQILNNLITNAIKFSKAEGTIEVELTSTDKEITLSVKDQGTGMPSEVKESLFQPFSKAHSLGTAGEKGTGLGLAIVHKIVTKHNGKIWVESEVGKGSTFFVTLPYKPST